MGVRNFVRNERAKRANCTSNNLNGLDGRTGGREYSVVSERDIPFYLLVFLALSAPLDFSFDVAKLLQGPGGKEEGEADKSNGRAWLGGLACL